ncbi:DUF503 domain-containing protein [Aerococcaceae bacterium WGS1372]
MTIILLTVSFIIDDSYSLKEKRRIVKSIVHKAQDRFKVSSAEVNYLDIVNQSEIAFVMVASNYKVARGHMEKIFHFIEENYPIQIYQYNFSKL